MHKVHTENLTNPERKALWRNIIEEYERSGLSQKKFCENNQIKSDLFSYHYRCKRQGGEKKMSPAAIKFIPIVPEVRKTQDIFHLKINQFELFIPPAFAADDLARIVNVLRAISC